ncbi:MAG: hypothetical protein M0Z79_07575 [Nitrospiraceae bacterium]|nr:hypothetical protein [Nitrospiraceae bacterium]
MGNHRDERDKSFYPDYLSEILVAIFLTIATVSILALVYTPSIDREINYVSAYHPKPEWYFLWIYQLIRYFPGGWAFVGTVVVPIVAAVLFISIPFVDRGNVHSGRVASILFALLSVFFLVLTVVPVLWP